MAMFRSQPDARPAWPSSAVPEPDSAALTQAARDNWFDSSWELRHGLLVAELEALPDDLDSSDNAASTPPSP